MPSTLVLIVVIISLITTALGVLVSLRRRTPGLLELGAAALAAAAVLVQSIVAAVRLLAGDRPPELATAIGYLVGIVFVLPLGIAWALAERDRWSGYVIAVAGFTTAVMTARLVMLWRGAGA